MDIREGCRAICGFALIIGSGILVLLFALLFLIIGAILPIATAVFARDSGQWSDQPPEIRQWFQSVMQPDNPAMSCCGEGDAFEVTLNGTEPDGSYSAIIVNGKGVYPDGAVVSVPSSKLQYKYGNPIALEPGHYILFIQISNGRPLCLIPGAGT